MVAVWLKDANVPYLHSKHLILTVVTSLLIVFFFLPYTLLLLLGHKLYNLSGRKYFRWLYRLKPLLDSYHAPYNINTRYWTGFLLLIRCALYIVFMLRSLSENKSFLAVALTFSLLGFVMGSVHAGRIYKKSVNNLLEAGTYLNLVILSTTALASLHSKVLVYSLVGLSFISMLLITVCQFHILYITKTALWQRLGKKWLERKSATSVPADTAPHTTGKMSHDPHRVITKTVIELREPLLEN
jgi:hypothetical protein